MKAGLLAGRAGGQVTVFTDNFNRANSTNLGSNWFETTGYGSGNLSIVSNRLQSTTQFGRFAMCKTATGANNQYAQITVVDHVLESYLIVRAAEPTIDDGGYYAGLYESTWTIGKMGVGVVVTTGGGTLSGDVIRLEARGNTITLKKNGATVLSTTDSTFPDGRYTGCYMAGLSGRMDNFEIGRYL